MSVAETVLSLLHNKMSGKEVWDNYGSYKAVPFFFLSGFFFLRWAEVSSRVDTG